MEARRKDVGFGGSESRVATSTLDNLDLLMEVVRRSARFGKDLSGSRYGFYGPHSIFWMSFASISTCSGLPSGRAKTICAELLSEFRSPRNI